MLIVLFLLIFCCNILCGQVTSSPIITFFIKPDTDPDKADTLKPFTISGKFSRLYIKHALAHQLTSGIYVSYAGYITTSDTNGQVMLPRINSKNNFVLVITPAIDPVILLRNTIDHFRIKSKEDTAVYKLERREQKNKQLWYWHIEKATLTGSRIPRDAIIIFAQPSALFMKIHETGTLPGPNILLPNLYSSKPMSQTTEALRLLKINRYFKPVQKTYAWSSERYASLLKH